MIVVNMIDYNSIKKLQIFLLFFIVSIHFCNAQFNLVNNPSFEQYSICPNSQNGLVNPTFWYQPSNQAGVYSNACSNDTCFKVPYNCVKSYNYQPARSGQALVYLDYKNSFNERTYLQSQLIDTLKTGSCYYVSFFVNLPSTLRYACNNNGLLFTNTPVYVDTNSYSYGVLPAIPQVLSFGNPIVTDTSGWQKISSIYVAQGGEKFITIGNFKYDSQTVFKSVNYTGFFSAGYMIDDVSVIPLDSLPLKADAGRDTTILLGDSVFIGSLTNGINHIAWYNSSGAKINTVAPGFYVRPTNSTFYVVEQTVCGYYSRDTVYIVVNPLPIKFTLFEARCAMCLNDVQLPSNWGVRDSYIENIWQTATEIELSHFDIERSLNGKDFITIGQVRQTKNKLHRFSDHLQINKFSEVYYRIVAIGKNSEKLYSGVQNVKLRINTRFGVFPNPAKDVLNISSKESLKEIQLINQFGQIIQQIKNINLTYISISLTPYSKGIYLIKTITNNETVSFEKFVKQ
jgi:hypothetical protein